MAISYENGHKMWFDTVSTCWRYSDNNEIILWGSRNKK